MRIKTALKPSEEIQEEVDALIAITRAKQHLRWHLVAHSAITVASASSVTALASFKNAHKIFSIRVLFFS